MFDPNGPTKGLFPQTELFFTAYIIAMLMLRSPIDIIMPTVTNLNNKNIVYEQWCLLHINSMAGKLNLLTNFHFNDHTWVFFLHTQN